MFISLHIPKTAGTSFRQILVKEYGEDVYLQYRGYKDSQFNSVIKPPINAKWIHGHFKADDVLKEYPNGKWITWLRHPVDRVASTYWHFKRNPDPLNELSCHLEDGKMSLIQFASLEKMKDRMTFFLGDLEVRDFYFIGITEYFSTDLSYLGDLLKRDLVQHCVFENTNPNKKMKDRYPLTQEDRNAILNNNQADWSMYQEVFQKKPYFSSLEKI